MLRRAEIMAAERGRGAVGLGVADDNPDALRLCQRLGYTTRVGRCVDRWAWVDHSGVKREEPQPCAFLASPLPEEADLVRVLATAG
ncbi:hypothetical protein I6A84_22830 [Frankia sp. CNm7]|uniref:Uncharacterized protein n=1 Tax=Frankia nepalensis TaxID=1836974 RepID=A0A937UUS2_9ACTN|nr:hypothetical protein [Frankia nepalensis]MBL7513454.1 hypothetical protein [Frankia nepalensis]MBL7520843.1 hypothetical protein [Frankia nepalensis]MBL7632550.1 hypothetical protein [Frankia nepalensis]